MSVEEEPAVWRQFRRGDSSLYYDVDYKKKTISREGGLALPWSFLPGLISREGAAPEDTLLLLEALNSIPEPDRSELQAQLQPQGS